MNWNTWVFPGIYPQFQKSPIRNSHFYLTRRSVLCMNHSRADRPGPQANTIFVYSRVQEGINLNIHWADDSVKRHRLSWKIKLQSYRRHSYICWKPKEGASWNSIIYVPQQIMSSVFTERMQKELVLASVGSYDALPVLLSDSEERLSIALLYVIWKFIKLSILIICSELSSTPPLWADNLLNAMQPWTSALVNE